MTSLGEVEAAATPTKRLKVEIMPSFAPRTAARSQPILSIRWFSECTRLIEGPFRALNRGQLKVPPYALEHPRVAAEIPIVHQSAFWQWQLWQSRPWHY